MITVRDTYLRMSMESDVFRRSVLNLLFPRPTRRSILQDLDYMFSIAMFAEDRELRVDSLNAAETLIDNEDAYSYGLNPQTFKHFVTLNTSEHIIEVKKSIEYFLGYFYGTHPRSSIFLISGVVQMLRLCLHQKFFGTDFFQVPEWLEYCKHNPSVFNPTIRQALDSLRGDTRNKFGDDRFLFLHRGEFDSGFLTHASSDPSVVLESTAQSVKNEQVLLEISNSLLELSNSWIVYKNPSSLRGIKKTRTDVEKLTEQQAKDELAKLRVSVRNSK